MSDFNQAVPIADPDKIGPRTEELFHKRRQERFERVDRMFIVLFLAQWVFAIGLAFLFSPYGWEGKVRAAHMHVYTAIFLGAAISFLPIVLAVTRPGWVVTRHVIAASQILWSALLIHLSGGRIETHFHIFGSLAFLAFYLDRAVLVTTTLFVAGDHLIRGVLWPESVYGTTSPEWWRFLEHAFWVVFENAILMWACVTGVREMRSAALQQATTEALTASEQQKSAALEMVLAELQTNRVAEAS